MFDEVPRMFFRLFGLARCKAASHVIYLLDISVSDFEDYKLILNAFIQVFLLRTSSLILYIWWNILGSILDLILFLTGSVVNLPKLCSIFMENIWNVLFRQVLIIFPVILKKNPQQNNREIPNQHHN